MRGDGRGEGGGEEDKIFRVGAVMIRYAFGSWDLSRVPCCAILLWRTTAVPPGYPS